MSGRAGVGRVRSAVAFVSVSAFVTGVSACSGDDDPIPTAAPPVSVQQTDDVVVSTSSPTTTLSTTTTVPPTTAAPTTAATSAPPSSATAPVETWPRTSLVTTDPTTLAIVDAVYRYYEALQRATRDPFDEALESAALATTTGRATDYVAGVLANMREQQRALRPNPDVPARLDIIEESIGVSLESPRVANVSACEVVSDLVVSPGTGVGGSDETVSAFFASISIIVDVFEVDGAWLVENSEDMQRYDQTVGCG